MCSAATFFPHPVSSMARMFNNNRHIESTLIVRSLRCVSLLEQQASSFPELQDHLRTTWAKLYDLHRVLAIEEELDHMAKKLEPLWNKTPRPRQESETYLTRRSEHLLHKRDVLLRMLDYKTPSVKSSQTAMREQELPKSTSSIDASDPPTKRARWSESPRNE